MVAAAVCIASCEGKLEEGGNTGINEDGFYEFPLNVQTDGFEAGNNGVSINVSSVKENNIIFNLVPGSALKSYRVEVYPKAALYNFLLNEGCVEASEAVCEDKIIQLVNNMTSETYPAFNAASYDDYSAKEFDWSNSEYARSAVLPDCDYFIMVLGYYDADGKNPASLSIAQVTTPMGEMLGNPQIAIETEVGYRAFIVQYHPNEDCRFFYQWIWSTKEISEFIDLFGDRMMRDFCRSQVTEPYDVTIEENLYVKRTLEITDNVDRNNTAIAVAVDANGNPSSEIIRNDFSLRDIPEGEFDPVAKINAGSRVGATIAYLDVEMEKNCMSCFYRMYTSDNAELIKGFSPAEKVAEAQSIANEGWGVANNNFAFNPDLEILTGDAYRTSSQFQMELKPNTEYVVVYVAKNYFGELSELCFSEPFTTKPLVRDNPEACVSDLTLELTGASRWGFTYNFTFDYETTACYRFQIVWPYVEDDPTTDEDDGYLRPPHYINDAYNRDKWMEFFYDTYQEGPAGPVSVVNLWQAEPSNHDGLEMFGYESGVTYVVAYCAEDVNGVVGPVKFAQITTTTAVPGPNPTIAISELEYDKEAGEVSGRFVANEDTKLIKYFCVTSSDASLYSSCALNDLVNSSRRDYNTYVSLWENQLMQLGLSSSAESVAFGVDVDPSSTAPVLIAAIAIGESDGEDVYSDLAMKIWHKGELKDLSDYRTPPVE